MSEMIQPIAERCAAIVELLGLAVIVGFAFFTVIYALSRVSRRRSSFHDAFRNTRHQLGRGILLGLEFLVAADIIHTVAVELTFETVGVLAIVVAIRTFLSFTLEVELTGKWPWQSQEDADKI
ncbi:MAG: DUF1622 domain-containing protein [Verrucomicrobiota bacterium]